jgi:hypothetical protein
MLSLPLTTNILPLVIFCPWLAVQYSAPGYILPLVIFCPYYLIPWQRTFYPWLYSAPGSMIILDTLNSGFSYYCPLVTLWPLLHCNPTVHPLDSLSLHYIGYVSVLHSGNFLRSAVLGLLSGHGYTQPCPWFYFDHWLLSDPVQLKYTLVTGHILSVGYMLPLITICP